MNGPEVELKLSTVLTETVIKSQRIEGLVVRGYNEDVEIPLQKATQELLYQQGRVRSRDLNLL